jgi:hypothetical protein
MKCKFGENMKLKNKVLLKFNIIVMGTWLVPYKNYVNSQKKNVKSKFHCICQCPVTRVQVEIISR